jgi:hypothetical protein
LRGKLQDPTSKYPKPPFNGQTQPWPGLASKMDPRPDHGEESYKGSGRCQKLVADAVNGLDGLDILVSNAGRQQSHPSILDLSTEQFDWTIKTNIFVRRPSAPRQTRSTGRTGIDLCSIGCKRRQLCHRTSVRFCRWIRPTIAARISMQRQR